MAFALDRLVGIAESECMKTIIEERLGQGLQDIRKGRVRGPFRSAFALVRSLRQKARNTKRDSRHGLVNLGSLYGAQGKRNDGDSE